ncbi:MAG: dihydroorotase [Acidobacteria bacterium]|nr:dihydroorotase [Acidobacteriota bacterium]
MSNLLIKNGRLIDPAQGIDAPRDLSIIDGKVSAIEPEIEVGAARVIDATGLVVTPGLIDLHVHLREPGFEYKETIESGARAAVAGGFTSICCMPNTQPVNDNSSITSFIIAQARAAGLANVFPIGAITTGSRGEHLAEIGEMRAAGIVAISDDGRPVANSGIMRRALEYASELGLPVVDHCEDCCGANGWSMHEGEFSALMGLRGLPGAAEDLHVARDLILAEMTGAHVHIAHISTGRSVDLVREARRRGVRVTCEVTPHHFTLSDGDLYRSGYDTNFKMAPPLRSGADVEAVLTGIADGTIDVIATDHAPHHFNEKMVEFDQAPNGIIGLETALPLALDRLVHRGLITLPRLVSLLATEPARVFNLDRGTLKVGAIADVTIIDPTGKTRVDTTRFLSKSSNSPFGGWELKGSVISTIVAGRVVFSAEVEPD